MAAPTLDLKETNNGPSTPQQEEASFKETSPSTPSSEQPQHERGEMLINWRAPEHVVYEKTIGWYIGFGVVLALLLFSAFLLKSILAGVVFLLLGILILVYSERKPLIVEYEIRTNGIRIGERVYPYRELLGFNLVEQQHGTYILLKSRRTFMPLIHVPLNNDTNPETVYEILIEFLDDDPEIVEPLADILAHWLGF